MNGSARAISQLCDFIRATSVLRVETSSFAACNFVPLRPSFLEAAMASASFFSHFANSGFGWSVVFLQ